GVKAEIQRLEPVVAKDRGRNAARLVALGGRAGGVKERPVVFDEARQRRLRQVETIELGVAALEFGDDAQGMAVVIEAAVTGHAGGERILAGVPERRMA